MKTAFFEDYTIYEDGTIINKHGKEIKKRLHNGRYETKLVYKGKRKNFIVSRLIYYVFVGFDWNNKDLCITHKDGNTENIHLNNLQLEHRKDLIQGEKHKKKAKLTNEQIEEIRQLYKGKAGKSQHNKTSLSLQDIANMYGVTKGNIALIIRGESRNKEEYKLK